MAYGDLLRDPRWQKKRVKILERDKWTCQCCGNTTQELQVHHLRYMNMPWDVPDNFLVTLCKDCHEKVSKPAFLSHVRREMSEGLMSDLYVLKTHIRYFEVEKLITASNHIG